MRISIVVKRLLMALMSTRWKKLARLKLSRKKIRNLSF